jgi:hypothetical protein
MSPFTLPPDLRGLDSAFDATVDPDDAIADAIADHAQPRPDRRHDANRFPAHFLAPVHLIQFRLLRGLCHEAAVRRGRIVSRHPPPGLAT